MVTRSGTIGDTITLGIKFYNNGDLFDPFSVSSVSVYNQAIGGSIIVQLVPVKVSTGFYQAEWSIPSNYTEATYYDSWTWVAEQGMDSHTQRYSFTIVYGSSVPTEPIDTDVGCRQRPSWEHLVGLRTAEDVGNGTGVLLSWLRAIPADSDNLIHYNIYYADTRVGVFGSDPEAMTTAQSVVVNSLSPGNMAYFAVRATEFDPTEFDIENLTQIGIDLYARPTEQTLLDSIDDAYGTVVTVEDASYFPAFGFLKVNYEIMKYSSKVGNSFYIEDTERGAYNTTIETHDIGETVTLFKGVEDGNSSIFLVTPSWHESGGTPRDVDAIGQYNVDADGYRAVAEDILTTDLTVSDENTEDFPGYDYTGYHKPSIQDTLSGECVGSYVGGEFDGGRGLNFQDRNLARLDALLQVTGEPVVLLKRKWTGKRCRCIRLQREHQRTRCSYCYGVGFEGGYDRYTNTRPISESFRNTQGYILMRADPHTDDLEMQQDQGLIQPMEVKAWTITIPTIKDRDIIIRFDEERQEEFRYEVLDVTRNKLLFSQTGHQDFRIRRHDKTDVIYQFDAVI